MSNVIVRGKVISGNFSKTSGSSLREMKDSNGNFLGYIQKLENGLGYKVIRKDGKIRVKRLLEDAYRTIARAN